MKKQELFDKVATHLMTQNDRALDDKRRPTFFAPDGKMCAIGSVMDRRAFEDCCWASVVMPSDIIHEYDHILPDGAGKHHSMLESLAYTHDALRPCDWMDELRGIASQEGVNQKVINEFSWVDGGYQRRGRK